MSPTVSVAFPAAEQQHAPRLTNLASCFQEVLTAIVRIRSQQHPVEDARSFRTQIRHALELATQQARSLGYSSTNVRAIVFATVAFLDESMLNQSNPTFADWARRPLQEELFGGHLAGEVFFQNLRGYLGQADSPEIADVLEVYCLCLLMGYRGRYALGDTGELFAMQREARVIIQRIRGEFLLIRPTTPKLGSVAESDHWIPRLLWIVVILLTVTILLFIGYHINLATHLSQAVQSTEKAAVTVPIPSRLFGVAVPLKTRWQPL